MNTYRKFKQPFFLIGAISPARRVVNRLSVDENPNVALACLGGVVVGGARSVPDRAARSNSERAAPSACVGNRFSAAQIIWNRSTRRAGARGGARVGRPRRLRILTITNGSSMAGSFVSRFSERLAEDGRLRKQAERLAEDCQE